MLAERLVLVVCGLILLLSTILVVQDYFSFRFIPLALPHPWDYVAHFLTCFAGVLFFSTFLQAIGYDGVNSLAIAIVLMLASALLKELIIDPEFSYLDMGGNVLGLLSASLIVYFNM